MKFTANDVTTLKNLLAVAKSIGVDSMVITDEKARGASADTAILTECHFSFDKEIKIGIGRVSELEKRFALFGDDVSIETKLNDKNETTTLMLSGGKSKGQYRCASERLIRYPKSKHPDDEVVVVVSLSKAEIGQVNKATKTFGAETVVIQVMKNGDTRVECQDPSTNDKFSLDLENQAEFIGDEDSAVRTYRAVALCSIMDHAAKESEKVDLLLGSIGSAELTIKGKTVLVMPQIGEEDDE